jgi:hypothetical protein
MTNLFQLTDYQLEYFTDPVRESDPVRVWGLVKLHNFTTSNISPMKVLVYNPLKHCLGLISVAILVMLLNSIPAKVFSQDTNQPADTNHVKFMIKHYNTIHSAGAGLCIAGAVTIAGGALVIVPTLGQNEANSVPNRNLGLYIMVGGLAVTMVGVIVLSQSGVKLKYYREQLKGLSVGLNPDPSSPGFTVTYRF